jgi:hypothetical protein
MKLRLKKKSKKLAKVKASECFNCGHPFFGKEKFCPECGQKNKNPQITFGNFAHEVFNGFISWDSKFWTTFIPLLIKPGKVSRDYIDGKRQRYANPFRFYLTISVLFFLMLGLSNSYQDLGYLNGAKKQNSGFIKINSDSSNTTSLDSVDIDKITTKGIDLALKNLDSVQKNELLKEIPDVNKDSIASKIKESILENKFSRFRAYGKKHPKTAINDALDSLNYPKTFFNRFIYDRTLKFKDFNQEKDFNEVAKKAMSYVSISLFVLLPIFAFALKLFYIRRKYTYVEHLVFIFHTQTVFFLLLLIFFPLVYYQDPELLIPVFLILFLIYLFLAMKRFYNQGYIKTFIKFIIINSIYLFLSGIGISVILLISFAFY